MSAAFEQVIRQNAKLKHFSPRELLFRGNAHDDRRSRGFGLNGDPPRELWTNILPTLQVLDGLRSEFRAPIQIISAYRRRRTTPSVAPCAPTTQPSKPSNSSRPRTRRPSGPRN